MERNLTLLMDLYELTMAYGYFKAGRNEQVVFDMFYRKNPDNGGFVIAAGLEQFLEYLMTMEFNDADIEFLRNKNLFDEDFLTYLSNFRFTGNVWAVPEGTIVYPNTPLVTIVAPLIEAQLIETMLLLTINHQSLIATKANRIVRAAKGRPVMEFGSRRAHGYDAANYGTRAAYIGGISSTANVYAEKVFGIPSVGTMAHSWIQFFENEYEAFKTYAETYPDSTVLLIDTYDVLGSGLPNAIRVAKEVLEPMGKTLKGVRLDSGDLAYLSKKVRKELDEAGLTDTKIIVSNSIDEYLIESLDAQGAKIDSFGIGERLITAKSEPVFGGVYKLAAVEEGTDLFEEPIYIPRIKISENIEKVTNPGFKNLIRAYDENGYGVFDLLTLWNEENIELIDHVYDTTNMNKEYKLNHNLKFEFLQNLYVSNGVLLTEELPTLEEIRANVEKNLETVYEEEKRFYNPHLHPVDLSEELYYTKMAMLKKGHI